MSNKIYAVYCLSLCCYFVSVNDSNWALVHDITKNSNVKIIEFDSIEEYTLSVSNKEKKTYYRLEVDGTYVDLDRVDIIPFSK